MALPDDKLTDRRDPPGRVSTVSERVDWICRRLAWGSWGGSREKVKLAARWEVSEETIAGYVGEATRRLQVSPDELRGLRLSYAALADKIARRAAKAVNIKTGIPEFGHALAGVKLAAQLSGIDPDDPLIAEGDGAPLRIVLEFPDGSPVGDGAAPPEFPEKSNA